MGRRRREGGALRTGTPGSVEGGGRTLVRVQRTVRGARPTCFCPGEPCKEACRQQGLERWGAASALLGASGSPRRGGLAWVLGDLVLGREVWPWGLGGVTGTRGAQRGWKAGGVSDDLVQDGRGGTPAPCLPVEGRGSHSDPLSEGTRQDSHTAGRSPGPQSPKFRGPQPPSVPMTQPCKLAPGCGGLFSPEDQTESGFAMPPLTFIGRARKHSAVPTASRVSSQRRTCVQKWTVNPPVSTNALAGTGPAPP